MGRFVVEFRILVGRIVNEESSITSWKVDRRVWTQSLGDLRKRKVNDDSGFDDFLWKSWPL
jgi:hypothetical protein